MKNYYFRYLLFTLVLGFVSLASAQDNTVRIPLKTLTKPAFDLVGADGKILSVGDIKSQFDKNVDLSTINPLENNFWQNTDLASNTAIDQNLHNEMPSQEEGLIYDSFVGVVRELGMYAINVRGVKNSTVVYRLKSGLQVHASLLKAALLRKIGIYQESPKYLKSIKLKFSSLEEMNTFIKQAFCVAGPDEVAISCLSLEPESRGFLSDKNESEFTLVVHGSYLEKLNAEVPNLFDGLTPSNQNTISLYAQSRAYRALIAPYMIGNAEESINRFSAQSVAVRGGYAYLNFAFSSDFNDITSYDDVRWILRKMSELTDKDWNEIVVAASYPSQLTALVKAKVLHRYNNMMETFFSNDEVAQLVRVQMPSLKMDSGDGIVVDGKVMKQQIPGYPQRFAHGDRKSPFEDGGFIKYLKIKAQSTAVEFALSQLSSKLQHLQLISQDIVGIEVGPNGVKPLVDAQVFTVGANATANRIITTGTFYGSQSAIQMVDSLSVSANLGYVHILDGLNGIDSVFGGGVSYIRNFVHVTPITDVKDVDKVKKTDLFIPTKLRSLTKPLKDGNLTEFLNSLKVGEVFTITDSIGLAAQIGYTTALDSMIGLSLPMRPTVGLTADANAIILRQTQFVRTEAGLQVYIRHQNNKAFGLELNVNYFINLLKIRYQTTKLDLHTDAYILNYNPELIGKVDSQEISPDEELQKKIDTMRGFGDKAALALRSLLRESNSDALDDNFKHQKFEIDHELWAKEFKVKLLLFRSNSIKEEHLLTIKKPEVPTLINGVQVVNQPIQIVTYKMGSLFGRDIFGFGLETAEGAIKETLSKLSLGTYAPTLGQATQNPSQMPFGHAEWTTIRTDTELTQSRHGALPSVAVIEHVWGGWSLSHKKMMNIIEEVKAKTKGINFADYPLVPEGALSQVKKVDFFRVTSHLSLLPDGVKAIKDLMLGYDDAALPSEPKQKFFKRFFKIIGQTFTGKVRAADKDVYNNLIKMIGAGDEKIGREVYMKQCIDYIKLRRSNSQKGFNAYYFGGSLEGTEYECLDRWMEKLIKLSRKFPVGDLREQNKWLAKVLYVFNEYIPLATLLNYLGAEKFIYYLEVTGFRTGDEDGDDGIYVSNVYGQPNKKHPYANGLISVIAEKSKINSTELEQTTGGF